MLTPSKRFLHKRSLKSNTESPSSPASASGTDLSTPGVVYNRLVLWTFVFTFSSVLGIKDLLRETASQLLLWLYSMRAMRRGYSLVRLYFTIQVLCNTSAVTWCHVVISLYPSGSVHYDEGESEAECLMSNIDMSNPIFQLYEAVRGARNNQGQLISEPFLQLPSRKDYPDYYQQISHPTCLHQIKYDATNTAVTLSTCPTHKVLSVWYYFVHSELCYSCSYKNFVFHRKIQHHSVQYSIFEPLFPKCENW